MTTQSSTSSAPVEPTVFQFGYDAKGNTISGRQAIAFDALNRVTEVVGKESYLYDGHGRRVKTVRASDQKINYSIYSLNGLLLNEEDERTNKKTDYVLLNGRLVAQRSAALTGTSTQTTTYVNSFLHTDLLGSPVAQSNATGTITRIERYTPYGEPSDQTFDQGPGYTGHITDALTGLTYAQQRYYDPMIGRFLSVDPVETDPSTGSAFNRFAYANNNPYLYTDPDGQVPNKRQAGTVQQFGKVMRDSPSRFGMKRGVAADQALQSMGATSGMKPVNTPYFNMKTGRYVYTKDAGWIDMVHFLYYAGVAREAKMNGSATPMEDSITKGFHQEKWDVFNAEHSAYSYEDLPSDKVGADFGANVFDPKSPMTLSSQIIVYLKKLGAANPKDAPNYNIMPEKDTGERNSLRNRKTDPWFTTEKKPN